MNPNAQQIGPLINERNSIKQKKNNLTKIIKKNNKKN